MPEERALCLFILLASPKKTNTNKKKKERTLAWTPQQLWPITAGLSGRKYFDNHHNKKDRFKSDFFSLQRLEMYT